jgi:hypothetical protein
MTQALIIAATFIATFLEAILALLLGDDQPVVVHKPAAFYD